MALAQGFHLYPSLLAIPQDYSICPGTQVQADHMPEVRSQDGMEICGAMVAWTLSRQYECRTAKPAVSKCETNMKNISKINSPLSFLIFYDPAMPGSGPNDHPIDFTNGGYLNNFIDAYSECISEACFDWDKFVSINIPDGQKHENQLAMNAELLRLKREFNTYKNQIKTEADFCVDCAAKSLAQESNQFFHISMPIESYSKALKNDDTYEQFLADTMLNPECKYKIVDKDSISLTPYPESGSLKNYEEMLSQTNKVLKQNKPVAFGFCLSQPMPSNNSCADTHQAIISGTAVMCSSSCPTDLSKLPANCKRAVHIVNSWGQDWQDTHHDGWVDGDNLFPYVQKGPNSLNWIQE